MLLQGVVGGIFVASYVPFIAKNTVTSLFSVCISIAVVLNNLAIMFGS